MTSSDDKLTIAKCPKCHSSHRYTLEVKRSESVAYTSLGARGTRIARFTRLFTCPVTEEDFQVSFGITEEPNAPIQAVGVRSLAAESTDEPKAAQ